MTTASVIAFAAFAVLALGDWVAVARGNRQAEYIFKPAALAALVTAAVVLDPAHGPQRWWFAGALALSLAGDVFLMLPSDRFVPGLASFLVAHLAYSAGLSLTSEGLGLLALGAAAVLLVAVPLGRRIIGGARERDRRLTAPVSAYVVVISLMVVAATGTADPWAIGGALLFYCSDAFIGWSRFVRPFRHHRLAIMVTYHAGQAGLVASLVS